MAILTVAVVHLQCVHHDDDEKDDAGVGEHDYNNYNVFVLMTVVTVVNLMALIMSKSIPVRTRSNASLSYTVIPPDSKYWL